jgi:hypothetical protein
MTTSPLLEQELDLRLATVHVDGIEIMNRAGRDVGGVTVMSPEENNFDSRIRDVAGTYVGWMREPDPVDVGASGVISVQLGSDSAAYLAKVAAARTDVDIVFTSNGSGLGFKTQTVGHAKVSPAPVTIEPNGVRMFTFIGWDYEEVPNAA